MRPSGPLGDGGELGFIPAEVQSIPAWANYIIVHRQATLSELKDGTYSLDEALDLAETINVDNYNKNMAHKVAEAKAKALGAARRG